MASGDHRAPRAAYAGRSEIQTLNIYQTMDLPLMPILLDMEDAGVRIDSALSEANLGAVEVTDARVGRACIYGKADIASTSILPSNSGDVLFNKMCLPKPIKYGRGKVVSTAQDVWRSSRSTMKLPAWCSNIASWRN